MDNSWMSIKKHKILDKHHPSWFDASFFLIDVIHLCGQMLILPQRGRGSQSELVKNGRSLITVASGLPVIVPSRSKTIPLRVEPRRLTSQYVVALHSVLKVKTGLKEDGGEDLKIW